MYPNIEISEFTFFFSTNLHFDTISHSGLLKIATYGDNAWYMKDITNHLFISSREVSESFYNTTILKKNVKLLTFSEVR